jgi:hypothetical protein
MTAELVMTKRTAHPGEVGLFIDSEIWEDAFSSIKLGAEVKAVVTVPGNLKYLKFFWALCDKLAHNCDWLVDKDDAKDKLLLEARHAAYFYDHIRKQSEIRSKSIANLSGDKWIRLLRRCSYAVATTFIPGMDENAMKAEIEKMISEKVPLKSEKKKNKGKAA